MAEETTPVEIIDETNIDVEELFASLRECYDPEIPVNVVDLGLIYNIRIEGPKVDITMTLTAVFCPVGPEVMAEVEGRVKDVPNVEACTVTLTYEPPWSPDRMTEDARWELGIG